MSRIKPFLFSRDVLVSYFPSSRWQVLLYIPEWPGGIIITPASFLRQFVTLTRETLGLRTGECRVQSCPLFHLSWSKQDKSIKFNCPFPTVRYYANACYCLPIKISSNLWFNLKWWHKHENFFAFGNIPFGGMGLLVFPQSLEIKTWDRWELSPGIGVN